MFSYSVTCVPPLYVPSFLHHGTALSCEPSLCSLFVSLQTDYANYFCTYSFLYHQVSGEGSEDVYMDAPVHVAACTLPAMTALHGNHTATALH